jgi:hypothetical protein
MILPTDTTRAQMDGLLAAREPGSVSIYVPTSPTRREDIPGDGAVAAILRHEL